MNENIDLIEILKDCPEGMALYSPLFGECRFNGIDLSCGRLIVVRDMKGIYRYFSNYGKYESCNSECLLFPSKNMRDWNKFKHPVEIFDHKSLKPYDKVLVRSDSRSEWRSNFFSHIDNEGRAVCVGGIYSRCVPCNETTKSLVGTTNECMRYYRWWEK